MEANIYFDTIDDISAAIERIIAQARHDFGHLNYEQLNWKPNATTWSVGQCLHHLVQAAAAYEPIFMGLIAGKQIPNFWRKLPVLPGIFGRSILKAVGPIRDKKTKTFPVFEPAQSDVPLDIIEDLASRLRHFTSLAQQLEHYDLKRTIVTSPVAKFVNYSLLDALNIVTVHNYRHFNQAQEVMALEGFPA